MRKKLTTRQKVIKYSITAASMIAAATLTFLFRKHFNGNFVPLSRLIFGRKATRPRLSPEVLLGEDVSILGDEDGYASFNLSWDSSGEQLGGYDMDSSFALLQQIENAVPGRRDISFDPNESITDLINKAIAK